ncbi:hypothetical protein N7499_012938 [Penicillium canescens]|uniref:Uncharacterized protein n=1 Tax=Penicillium canescens TaxID=5083 RepID=A0AAD6N5J3_PENCN|nr:uncharacterized protein N7446_000416 [Penicillium canescens]KAJ6012092.1 hypothetical protein N7522_002447 [Penicillium canescens]KAJ6030520.1 hypothetical protein N7460_010786 [Penicillium canescens]KAJ6059765.1 hypothetical protein N7444_003404 [Penicillium canescens]KAJ6064258.1 hypothetical protein N7499_012938 [Penicillium canescens]KAJ6077480.1 hypothetical protein N7446_000416 [Penicillium canescens]
MTYNPPWHQGVNNQHIQRLSTLLASGIHGQHFIELDSLHSFLLVCLQQTTPHTQPTACHLASSDNTS